LTAAGNAADDCVEVEGVVSLADNGRLGGFITRDCGKTSDASDDCVSHPLP